MANPGTTPRVDSDLGAEVEREAEQVLPAPPGHPRFPLLDPIRAFAAIAVLVVHVGIYSGGFDPWYKQLFAHLDIGVTVFFLLSGFLLYRPMLAARVLGARKQRIVDYARNRAFRIFPAFWAVLALSALLPMFHGAFSDKWWVHFGLLQNWPVYTPEGVCAMNPIDRGPDQFCGLPPAWSLSIEMMFYAVLPFFALAMAGLNKLVGGGRKWVPIEIIALLVIAVASFFIQRDVPFGDLDRWLFYSPLGRGYWFALGMGLAVASVWVQTRNERPRLIGWIAGRPDLWWTLAIGIYAFTSLVLLPATPVGAAPVIESSRYLLAYFLFGVVSALILLPAVFGQAEGGLVRRLLATPVLAWLGLISYGIFLWHYPVMAVLLEFDALTWIPGMQFPVLVTATFIGTVVMAALSFYLIERPLLIWSRSRNRS